MKNGFLAALAAIAVVAGFSGTASAGSASASSTVSINYTGACEISAGSPSLTYAGDDTQSLANVTVNCSSGALWTLEVGQGLNFWGGVHRAADGAGGFLRYRLFKDAGLTQEVDFATSNVFSTGTGTGVGQDSIVYYGVKKVDQFEAAATGNYTDTLDWTVTF